MPVEEPSMMLYAAGSVHGHFTKRNAHQQGYNYVHDIVCHVCALRLVKPIGGDIPIVVQGPKCPITQI
jgi:hypothetical protein